MDSSGFGELKFTKGDIDPSYIQKPGRNADSVDRSLSDDIQTRSQTEQARLETHDDKLNTRYIETVLHEDPQNMRQKKLCIARLKNECIIPLHQAIDDLRRLSIEKEDVGQVEAEKAEGAKYEKEFHEALAEIQCFISKTDELHSQYVQFKRLEEQQRVNAEKKHLLQEELASANLAFEEGEKLRRKLHNKIMDLKGNIRVFCRVRPSPTDDRVISFQKNEGIDVTYNGNQYSFAFDKVFTHHMSQEEVYVEISLLVQSAIDGHKVCIFAYGQTGSGKTYTMIGKPDQRGMIPRAVEQIFDARQSLEARGWKFELQVSIFEIYNNIIYDFLPIDDASQSRNVKQDTSVHGSFRVCASVEQVYDLLDQATKRRSQAMTQSNAHSSRSHFVFTLRISGCNESTDAKVEGELKLIDLAGSERPSISGVEGEQLKEAKAINQSLLALGNIIRALASKQSFIPYRGFKLTEHLKDYLDGDSKMLMFLNVSEDPSSAGESLQALTFGNAVKICAPRRQI